MDKNDNNFPAAQQADISSKKSRPPLLLSWSRKIPIVVVAFCIAVSGWASGYFMGSSRPRHSAQSHSDAALSPSPNVHLPTITPSLPPPRDRQGTLPLPADWKTYVSEEYGFVFRYPPDATLHEGSLAGFEGPRIAAPGVVELDLDEECYRFTIAVATNPEEAKGFTHPNVFDQATPKRRLTLDGRVAWKTTAPLPGVLSSDQVGFSVGDRNFLLYGEPCLSATGPNIIGTFHAW